MRKFIAALSLLALSAAAPACDGDCHETDPIFIEGQVTPVCLFGATPVGGSAEWRCSCPVF